MIMKSPFHTAHLFSLLVATARISSSTTEASLFGVARPSSQKYHQFDRSGGASVPANHPEDVSSRHIFSFSSESSLEWLTTLRGGASDKSSKKNNNNKIDGPCIGIDLGTTYSCVAVWKNNRVDVCVNEQGHRITPSYVAFCPDGTRLIGDAAKNQAPSNSGGTIFDVKRLIGRKYQDATVQSDKALFPFDVESDKNGKPIIRLSDDLKGKHSKTDFTPEEISGLVLRKMKEIGKSSRLVYQRFGTLITFVDMRFLPFCLFLSFSRKLSWLRSQACGCYCSGLF